MKSFRDAREAKGIPHTLVHHLYKFQKLFYIQNLWGSKPYPVFQSFFNMHFQKIQRPAWNIRNIYSNGPLSLPWFVGWRTTARNRLKAEEVPDHEDRFQLLTTQSGSWRSHHGIVEGLQCEANQDICLMSLSSRKLDERNHLLVIHSTYKLYFWNLSHL